MHEDFPDLDVRPQVGCNCATCVERPLPHLYTEDDIQTARELSDPLTCPVGRRKVPWEQVLQGYIPEPSRTTDLDDPRWSRHGTAEMEQLTALVTQILGALPTHTFQIAAQGGSAHSESNPTQTTDIRIDIDLIQEQCADFRDTAQLLHEDLEDEDASPDQLADLEKRLARLDKALGEIGGIGDAAEAKTKRGPLKRLKSFVEGLNDGNDLVGKAIKAGKTSGRHAGELIDLYNTLGPLAGLPPVPNPFKAKATDGKSG